MLDIDNHTSKKNKEKYKICFVIHDNDSQNSNFLIQMGSDYKKIIEKYITIKEWKHLIPSEGNSFEEFLHYHISNEKYNKEKHNKLLIDYLGVDNMSALKANMNHFLEKHFGSKNVDIEKKIRFLEENCKKHNSNYKSLFDNDF